MDKLTPEEVQEKLNQATELLREVGEADPAQPIVFYATGETKYLSLNGNDYILLGMLSELQAIVSFPSAASFHAFKRQQDPPRIVTPGLMPLGGQRRS